MTVNSSSYLLLRLEAFECAHFDPMFSFPRLQISYRLAELTNTFKMAFVPNRDNKRIMHNIITAAAIMGILYSLSFLFL